MSPPIACAIQYVGTRDHGCLPAIASPNVVAGLKWPPESPPKAETATESPRPCASAMATRLSPPVAMIAPAPTKKNRKVPATSARRARICPVIGGYSAHMADFRPVEANKGHILMIHPATADTTVEDANAEWVEIIADLSSDFANWRLQHLRGLWKPEVAKPVEWEWVYTWGSP